MMINEAISHFKIVGKIDEGGMGEIFLAHDTWLNRQVALKSLPPHLTSNADLIDRFKREAQAAAALKHPNIVTVYELFKHGDRFYIAMEYIEGTCLSKLVDSKQLSIQKAIFVAIQICRGLRKAHNAGIIHRDIKPANIMVDKEGWIKILDFGLAKLVEFSRITRHGVRMGTARYISPEQIRGEELSAGSDIFSLGVILYELITGVHPFEGKTEEEIMYAILQKRPEPLSRHRDGITPGLQRLVEKALRKEPANRYRRIQDFMIDLKHEKRNHVKSSRPKARKPVLDSGVFTIKDIDTKRFRLRWIRFTTRLIMMRAKIRQRSTRKAAIVFAGAACLIMLAGVSWRYYETHRGGVGEKSAAESVHELLKVKEASLLHDKLAQLNRRKLVSFGRNVDFTLLDQCYLFIIDGARVLDVFVIDNNQFQSLETGEKYTTPPNRYAGKTKIWVQDLTTARASLR